MMMCSAVHGTSISRIRLQSRKPINIAALYSAAPVSTRGAGPADRSPAPCCSIALTRRRHIAECRSDVADDKIREIPPRLIDRLGLKWPPIGIEFGKNYFRLRCCYNANTNRGHEKTPSRLPRQRAEQESQRPCQIQPVCRIGHISPPRPTAPLD